CPAISPEKLPGLNMLRSGRAAVTIRAVSTSIRLVSSERAPRTVLAISEPMAASATATTASATSTSISMKPWASRRSDRRQRASRARRASCTRRSRHAAILVILKTTERGNFYASRQPIDADLVPGAQPAERDHAAARHAAGKEADGGTGETLIA